jgi:hypothetical protein
MRSTRFAVALTLDFRSLFLFLFFFRLFSIFNPKDTREIEATADSPEYP